MGHQTQVKELLAREQILLSCINTMQDRFNEAREKGCDYLAAQTFAIAYLRAYGILIGWRMPEELEELTGDEVGQFNPEEPEGREGE